MNSIDILVIGIVYLDFMTESKTTYLPIPYTTTDAGAGIHTSGLYSRFAILKNGSYDDDNVYFKVFNVTSTETYTLDTTGGTYLYLVPLYFKSTI